MNDAINWMKRTMEWNAGANKERAGENWYLLSIINGDGLRRKKGSWWLVTFLYEVNNRVKFMFSLRWQDDDT